MRCGLYTSSDAPVPLEGTHVEARIVDMIAEVNVLQFYVNHEAQPIEAKYIFPLDSNAAVFDFQYEINGKIVQSQVKEKQQAKKEYEEAIRRGDGAALLEQEKADIFQISVGNIPASTRVNVKISYVVEMDNEEDFAKFLLPTTVAPRYVPAGHTTYHTTTTTSYKWIPYYRPWHHCWCDCFHWDRYYHRFVEVQKVRTHVHHHPDPSNTAVIQAVNANQSETVPFALSLYLHVEMPSDIEEVVSTTHQIQTTKESPRVATVMFVKDSEALDKDVVIKFRTVAPHQPRAILENCGAEISGQTGSAVMLTLVPQFVLNDIQAEFIFIVDRSGSMSGSKMTQTRSALQLFLRALPANSYFNIIGFGSSHRSLFNTSQPYNESAVQKALDHAKTLNADLGGTELMAPLRAVYSQAAVPNYARQIFVLTDGEVSNTEEVVRLVRENHKTRSTWRLFTIGVGSSVSHALVNGMARAGRGTVQIIGDGERLEPKVMGTLKQALQPALTNLKVDWGATAPAPTPAPATGFATMAPKIGCLIGHRVGEQKKPASSAVRNDLVYQAPYNLPPIFSNKRFICYAYLHPSVNPEKITLTADSPDGPLDVTLPIERTTGAVIHRLAARALIRDLEEGSSHLHDSSIRPDESKVKSEIVSLGLKFNLASKHTSFVAIEDRSEERANGWFFSAPQQAVQPQRRMVGMAAPAPAVSLSRSSRGAAPKTFSLSAVGERGGGGAPMLAKKKSASSKGAVRKEKKMADQFCYRASSAPADSDDEEMDFGCSMEGSSLPCTSAPAFGFAPPPAAAPSFSRSSSSAAPPPAPSASASRDPRTVLASILDQQKLDGSFEATAQLASLLRLAISELNSVPSALAGVTTKIWVTALVLAFFRQVLAGIKDEWELVGDKSKGWIASELKKQGSSTTADSVISKATETLTQAGIF